jgi:hypothetical protein
MRSEPLAPGGRRGKRLLRVFLALVATLVLLELAFRALLFLDVPGLKSVSARLRQPQNFFHRSNPDYWVASVMLTPPERLKPVPGYDPLLGWRGSRIAAETFEHKDEKLVLGRRPVLLYGDSFAECTTPPKECWEGLLAGSELRSTHFLLNYGVGGYGFDQIFLMLRASVDRFVEQDPVVVIGVMVDDDLDRSLLPFRGWPKPRLAVRDGRLVEPEPVAASVEEFVAAERPEIWSWAWRYLRQRSSSAPDAAAEEARRAEVRELTRAILVELKRELDARGLQWFVLVFQGSSVLEKSGRDQVWQYGFVLESLRELGIPYVSSREALMHHRNLTGTDTSQYFEASGRAKGHFTALGNQAVFPALVRGIEGQFD